MRLSGPAAALLSALVLFSPRPASAAPCVTGIAKTGSFPQAQHYLGKAEVPSLKADSALAQLRAIFQLSRIRILAEDRATGRIRAEIPAALLERAIAINATAQEQAGLGVIQLTYDVAPDELIGGGWVRKHMCSILTQLRGDGGRSLSVLQSPPRTTKIEAVTLTRQVERAKTNPARVEAEFVGRDYQVSGLVLNIFPVRGGYAVWFEGEPLSTDSSTDWQSPKLAVKCLVPASRVRAAAALTVRARGTLTGRFTALDTGSRAPAVILEDCQ